jgi:hypothetical protein
MDLLKRGGDLLRGDRAADANNHRKERTRQRILGLVHLRRAWDYADRTLWASCEFSTNRRRAQAEREDLLVVGPA